MQLCKVLYAKCWSCCWHEFFCCVSLSGQSVDLECLLSSPLGWPTGGAIIGHQPVGPLILMTAAMGVVRRGTMPMIVNVTAVGVEAGNPIKILDGSNKLVRVNLMQNPSFILNSLDVVTNDKQNVFFFLGIVPILGIVPFLICTSPTLSFFFVFFFAKMCYWNVLLCNWHFWMTHHGPKPFRSSFDSECRDPLRLRGI